MAWMAGLGLMVAVVMSGCGLEGELGAMRDRAEALHARIERDRAELESAAAALPSDDPARARMEALASERSAQSAAVVGALTELEALIASAKADPGGALESGAGLLIPLLPAGARAPVLLGVGLAGMAWRAARLKKSAASIAESFEKAMRQDEQLAQGVRRNAGVLRSIQTGTARRIVDEATRPERAMLRLPV
jgi:hypothetical protein